MQKMRVCGRLAIICIALSFIAGCGQKGDLYLPEGSLFITWIG